LIESRKLQDEKNVFMSPANSSEDTVPSKEEVYKTLLRSLRLKKGFGIVFVQCSPAEATTLIREVQQDLPKKRIGVIELTESIDNLYDLVANRADCSDLNILFIRGLEKSLEPYIKPGYGGEGNYYQLDTVPKILGHLNQRRESFRDKFSNICFVLILPLFAIKFFIRRAPDFFDWSSGVFEFPDKQEQLEQSYEKLVLQGEYDEYIKLTEEERTQKLFEFEKLLENEQFSERKAMIWREQGRLFAAGQDFASAVASFDEAIEIKPDYHEAWYGRGFALGNLGRYEEAVASFDEAIKIKPDHADACNNRGFALHNLGRYEEAVASFDEAVKIKPDYHQAWYNRGIALRNLGRNEDAVGSYNEAVKIKPDYHEAWYNQGIALHNLGRYEEASKSHNKAIEINPKYAGAWYNVACANSILGNIDAAIENLQTAINLDAKYREMAKTDADFDNIRNDARFQALINQQ
jgi:tetratricopeptide (TPR) repeat protein